MNVLIQFIPSFQRVFEIIVFFFEMWQLITFMSYNIGSSDSG